MNEDVSAFSPGQWSLLPLDVCSKVARGTSAPVARKRSASRRPAKVQCNLGHFYSAYLSQVGSRNLTIEFTLYPTYFDEEIPALLRGSPAARVLCGLKRGGRGAVSHPRGRRLRVLRLRRRSPLL